TIPFALAITLAGAQTTNQSQIRHVETSLNHLTVLEFGEPVTTLAVADPDSFMVERHDDKVFVMPLREKVSTNLFVWTASRQLSYELDPAGQLAAMDVLIRNEPPVDPHTSLRASAETTDEEIRKIASLVLTQTMMGVQDIARDPAKPAKDRIQIDLEQVYRSKDQLYIRYSVTNQTRSPFRLTTPDVSAPLPTQQPISLLSLRNHQLSPQTFGAFKAKTGPSLAVVQADSVTRDLAPGQKTTGVVSIGSSQGNPPALSTELRGRPGPAAYGRGRPVAMDAQNHVSPEEVHAALRSIYRDDPESNLQQALLRSLADDLKPVDGKGRWKPSPLVILVSALVCALMGVFFYFTLGGHR
ncbi:MAG: TrbG/VirB9 family P-type conjugative transfer protein, partial [Silvibacterium sp.]